jgi:folate-dependent phosphoribosylglycinamide formyltransferase PurN
MGNLQALIDAITFREIIGVISNKADAYALERAKQANIETLSLNIKLIQIVKCLMMPCINNLYMGN